MSLAIKRNSRTKNIHDNIGSGDRCHDVEF